MIETEIFAHAEAYLIKRKISFVKPGNIGRKKNDRIEIIFLIPESLDPNIVVDPPDVCVWVNIHTGRVTLIDQM